MADLKNYKISVIVPAYNVADQLKRCLDSIIRQEYRNLEIIVIDDGSTDQTPTIIDHYAAVDSRIIAVHQSNIGLIETREKGIRLATGDFIGFVDGDDVITPEMYDQLLRNALDAEADISCCGILYCFYDGRTKKSIDAHSGKNVYDRKIALKKLLYGELEPSLCSKLYRSSLLKNSCLDKSLINNEDLLRNFVLFDRSRRVVVDSFCGYEYWRHGDSMSNNSNYIRILRDRLAVRETILKNAGLDIRNDAAVCRLMGLLTVYSKLREKTDSEAARFRSQCLNEIRQQRADIPLLTGKMKAYAYLTVYIPAAADCAGRIHRKITYIKVRINKRLKNG